MLPESCLFSGSHTWTLPVLSSGPGVVTKAPQFRGAASFRASLSRLAQSLTQKTHFYCILPDLSFQSLLLLCSSLHNQRSHQPMVFSLVSPHSVIKSLLTVLYDKVGVASFNSPSCANHSFANPLAPL